MLEMAREQGRGCGPMTRPATTRANAHRHAFGFLQHVTANDSAAQSTAWPPASPSASHPRPQTLAKRISMLLRQQSMAHESLFLVFLASLWLSLPTAIHAQDPFDCKVSLDGGKASYDLTTIAGEHSISRTCVTPPTSQFEEVRFDLCADLPRKEGVADGDQVRLNYCR